MSNSENKSMTLEYMQYHIYSYNRFVRWTQLLPLCYRWVNRSLMRLSKLPKVKGQGQWDQDGGGGGHKANLPSQAHQNDNYV